jgi:hypothetical protein
VDGIVICTGTHKRLVCHVQQVMQSLWENGLAINDEKRVWAVPELDYLGHKISAAGFFIGVRESLLERFLLVVTVTCIGGDRYYGPWTLGGGGGGLELE